jgi:hypothetical protein
MDDDDDHHHHNLELKHIYRIMYCTDEHVNICSDEKGHYTQILKRNRTQKTSKFIPSEDTKHVHLLRIYSVMSYSSIVP